MKKQVNIPEEKLKRQVIRLAAAWEDFEMVDAVAGRALTHLRRLGRSPVGLSLAHRNATFYALQTTCIVCYTRPFTSNEGLGHLTGRLAMYRDPASNELHDLLLLLRHSLVAHSNINFRSIQVFPIYPEPHNNAAHDRFTLATSKVRLESQHYTLLRRMCKDRKAIIWPMIQATLSHLYPSPGKPYGPVLLNHPNLT